MSKVIFVIKSYNNMEHTETLRKLSEEVKAELENNILPFWRANMTDPIHGGFIGRISGNGDKYTNVPKGAILNARILWSFSAAFRVLKNKEDLKTATIAKREIIDRFYDTEYGGIYWSLNPDGTPKDTKKQIYAIGFAIYGLSEYYRATGDIESLEYAIRLFHDIETHSFDKEKNGYYEAFSREWTKIEDMRLSEKDSNECKTMNTHLHILEASTSLYRIWKDPFLEKQLRNLIKIFTDKILDTDTGHLQLFFNQDWESCTNIISFGHDIEASWLLHEAAEVLEDKHITDFCLPFIKKIAMAASEGIVDNGGMIYEFHRDNCSIDASRHWWVQAETVIGLFNLWQITGDYQFLKKATICWDFIKKHIIDKNGGEWFWSLNPDGSPNTTDDKAGFWKCPYHNSRMCLEIIERVMRSL